LVAIVASFAIGKNHYTAEIAAKTQFSQLKNLSNVAVLLWFGHILDPWFFYNVVMVFGGVVISFYLYLLFCIIAIEFRS